MNNKEEVEQTMHEFKIEILEICEKYGDKLDLQYMFYIISRIRACWMIDFINDNPEKEVEIFQLSSIAFEEGEKDYKGFKEWREKNAT